MKRNLPLLVFFLALAVAAGVIHAQGGQLPERVASHFDAHGRADGWSSRAAVARAFFLLALGLPAAVAGAGYLVRFLPAACLAVPNAAYWRAPQNRPRACSMILRSSLWLGAGMALWTACLHGLVVAANRMQLATLDGKGVALLAAALAAGVFAWIASLMFRFAHNP